MLAVAGYLAERFFHRVFEFLEHWYWGSFRVAGGRFFDLLKSWDRFFALRITIRHWLQPLYQDRTFIGYVLGPIFRTGRIIIGASVYLAVTAIAVLFYFLWLLVPPFLLYKIVSGFYG